MIFPCFVVHHFRIVRRLLTHAKHTGKSARHHAADTSSAPGVMAGEEGYSPVDPNALDTGKFRPSQSFAACVAVYKTFRLLVTLE
jgi:hypothetical protein